MDKPDQQQIQQQHHQNKLYDDHELIFHVEKRTLFIWVGITTD